MSDSPICDVAGCSRPSIDCIGGEVWYCAEHVDQAADVYWAWRDSPERAARASRRGDGHDALQHDDCAECGTSWR